ncbi:chloroplast envelope quinone oxidoreductase homolog [Pistacia vera]|uniref:chloroplast envelope quinone oxidoreductase homolog n=1 Tax=Pistacia vera TaxID=55513 RepID=UPI001263CDE6|nr:chloroplast envelope quinone oxidoreductase homolog [Pistacia vera]
MEEPEEGATTQHRRDRATYDMWKKKNSTACITLLSSMDNDPMTKYREYELAKDIWSTHATKFGDIDYNYSYACFSFITSSSNDDVNTGGGLAEFAVAKESLTVRRPPEVSAAEGAGLPVAGLTAHQALTQSAGIKLDGSGKETNILITAASGGVGHYAVQLAKLGNTHVTATCGARNIEFVKSLGADEVLDYKTPDGAALKSPSGRKYDAVIHCASAMPWSTFEPNLSSNGKVIEITPGPSTLLSFALGKLTFSKKQFVPLLLIAKKENLDFLVKLVKEGKLKTVIDSKHPLSKAEAAWAKSIDGHATGKIIVEP